MNCFKKSLDIGQGHNIRQNKGDNSYQKIYGEIMTHFQECWKNILQFGESVVSVKGL